MPTMVDWNELELAFDFVNFGDPSEHEAYLCLETGKIYWHSEYGDNDEELPDDIFEPGKYIDIPHKNDLDLGRNLVFDFAAKFMSDDDYHKVREIFSRSGAYRRFKDLLEYRELLNQWHQFEEQAQREALHAWCQEVGITISKQD